MKTGSDLIAEERHRQEAKEGWSPGHDDSHEYAELRLAAEAYLFELSAREIREGGKLHKSPPPCWPWDSHYWKPTEDIVRQLVKAGALIAAEIDRLQRIKPPNTP